MLINGVNKNIGAKLDTVWLPEYAFVLSSSGYCSLDMVNFNTDLAYHREPTNEEIEVAQAQGKKANDIFYINPIVIEKRKFDGNLYGYGKMLFCNSDGISTKNSEWFKVRNYLYSYALSTKETHYKGNLVRFNFNPIVSYQYIFKKTKKGDIVSPFNYIILDN